MEGDSLDVGRIVKAHGLKGHVIVDLWTDRTERLDVGSQLETDRGTLTVESASAHQERYIVRFDRIVTRDDADQWRGVVLRATRLNEDELWIDQLFGARVVDQHGVDRGIVTDVEANPASDLLVLDSGSLVPLTFVVSVLAHERIEVDVPDGLFE